MHAEILLELGRQERARTLTYRVPKSLEARIQTGTTVQVPLRQGVRTGIVVELHERALGFAVKEILAVKEGFSLLEPWQIELADWIAHTTFAPLYSVFKMMLPPNVRNPQKKIPDEGVKHNGQAIRTPETIAEPPKTLTTDQQNILTLIDTSTQKKFLLHGVTGSGKTEIYLQLAQKTLAQGKQVMILVPEVALTPQMIERFEQRFPGKVAVLHSYLGTGEREREWWRIKKGQASVVVGSRSAIFAPIKRVGLVVVDEEHETSYKQESTPCYHARDVALYLGEQSGATILLGSATPSLETRYAAQQGQLGYLRLCRRVQGTGKLPPVQVIDMREELHKKNTSIFSEALLEKLTQTLKNGQQTILFLNRRGHSSCVLCRVCGQAIACPRCTWKLTHHRSPYGPYGANRLLCHHCNWAQAVPDHCPECGSSAIKFIGLGTQKVETELQKLFPFARILRADRDTMRRKGSFQTLYSALKNKNVDILIGTQMIGKGLDLPNVALVGVLLADIGLHLPDFRAAERCFQLLTQVAGRTGRNKDPGQVIIQTYNPNHPSIEHAASHNDGAFFKEELEYRKELSNPPFARLIKLTYSHKNQKKCSEETEEVANKLKIVDLEHTVTHAPAFILKENQKYRYQVFIQGKNPGEILRTFLRKEPLKQGWSIEIDPLAMV